MPSPSDLEVLPVIPTLAHTDPDDDADVPTTTLADGRDWAQDLVVSEIASFQAQALICAFEIGKRLLWAKRELGHGRFEGWAEESLAMSGKTRRRFCQYALFFLRHPKLYGQLEGAPVKKILLLTSLPDGDIEAMSEGVSTAGVSMSDVATLPYVELKKRLEKQDREVVRLAAEVEAKTEKVNEYSGRIADLTAPKKPAGDDSLRRDLQTVVDGLRMAYLRFHVVVDRLTELRRDDLESAATGGGAAQLSPELALDLVLAVEGAEAMGVHAKEKYRLLVGEAQADADYVQAVARARGLPANVTVIDATVLPFAGDDESPTPINQGRMAPRPTGFRPDRKK